MSSAAPADRSFPWFQLFKYTVYALLAVNVLLFLEQETLAAEHLFTGDIQLSQLIQAFAATLDTGAWVILLLLFELETCVLPDEKIKGSVKFALHGARVAAYLVIIYAFYGYLVKCLGLYQFSATSITDLCSLVGKHLSFMTDLDEFSSLSLENCKTIATSASILELTGSPVITDANTLAASKWLAWTDVINAGNWLLILVILEIDVRLQHKGRLEGHALRLSKTIKIILYAILVGAAIYWGVAGDFLDFWDALLWILAFVFIELNVFEWRTETAKQAANL